MIMNERCHDFRVLSTKTRINNCVLIGTNTLHLAFISQQDPGMREPLWQVVMGMYLRFHFDVDTTALLLIANGHTS